MRPGSPEPLVNWSHPLAVGLRYYYPFSQGAGTDLIAEVARHKHAYWNDSPAWTLSPVGPAGFFDGGAMVQLPQNWLAKIDDFALGAWFRTDAASQEAMVMSDGTASDGYAFGQGSGGGGAGANFSGLYHGISWFNSAVALTVGRWYHGILTRRAGTTSMFLNGLDTGMTSGTAPNLPAFAVATIGAQDASSRFFQGAIAHAAVWERGLTVSDARWLYEEPDALLVVPRRRSYGALAAAAAGSRSPGRRMVAWVAAP